MRNGLFDGVTLTAAIGSALVAGVFYAFSTFVMRALARLPAHEGLAAMQAINVAVINPLFMGLFLGTAALCAASLLSVGLRWDQAGAAFVLAGALLYLIGTLGVTIACNVPLNDAIAPLSPGDAGAAARWADYVTRWTMWNHVRMAAAIAAAVSFALGLRR